MVRACLGGNWLIFLSLSQISKHIFRRGIHHFLWIRPDSPHSEGEHEPPLLFQRARTRIVQCMLGNMDFTINALSSQVGTLLLSTQKRLASQQSDPSLTRAEAPSLVLNFHFFPPFPLFILGFRPTPRHMIMYFVLRSVLIRLDFK